MADLHTCAHPRCEEPISGSVFACRPHWFALPQHLRYAIWNAYDAYLADDLPLAQLREAQAAAIAHWNRVLEHMPPRRRHS